MSLLQLAPRLGVRRLAVTTSRSVSALDVSKGFATGPAAPKKDEPKTGLAMLAEDSDRVVEIFKMQQQMYRAFLKEMKNIKVPMSGEEKAVRKYADEMEALKKKLGIPNCLELLRANLGYKFKCARGNVKEFLQSALDDPEVNLSGHKDAMEELLATVDQVEKETGAPVNRNDKNSWEVAKPRLLGILKKFVPDEDKMRKEAIYLSYKEQIDTLRKEVSEEIEAEKKRQGLENIDVDISTIQPRFLR